MSTLAALNASLDQLTSDLKSKHRSQRAAFQPSAEHIPKPRAQQRCGAADTVHYDAMPRPEDSVELETSEGLRAAVVRSDGTATAWYHARRVAIAVTRVAERWSIFAAHPDGTMALRFGVDGSGVVNHPPPSSKAWLSIGTDGAGVMCNARGDVQRRWSGSGATTFATGDGGTSSSRGVHGRALGKNLGVRFTLATRRLEVFYLYRGAHAVFVRGPNAPDAAFSFPPRSDLFGRPRKLEPRVEASDDGDDENMLHVPEDMTVAQALEGMLRATNEATALLSLAGERRAAANTQVQRRPLHEPRQRRQKVRK